MNRPIKAQHKSAAISYIMHHKPSANKDTRHKKRQMERWVTRAAEERDRDEFIRRILAKAAR